MVKLKNVKRAQAAARTGAAAGTRTTRRRTPRGPTPAGIAIGVLGWLAAAAAFAMVIASVVQRNARIEAIRAETAAEVARVKASVQERSQELEQRRNDLGTAINQRVKDQETLSGQTKGLEVIIAELEPEVRNLERTEEKLQQRVQAIQEESGLTTEGLEELQARVQKMEQRKAELVTEYRRRFEDMKAVFDEKVARGEPELLRLWYGANKHTVFAPAAAFHAADMLYEGKRSTDALRLYREIVRLFPECEYADLAERRMAEIDARVPYKALDPPLSFQPYHPPKPEEN